MFDNEHILLIKRIEELETRVYELESEKESNPIKVVPKNDAYKEIKEKLSTGNYNIVFKQKINNKWSLCYRPNDLVWRNDFDYKVIHRKHRNILDAYLEDNNVEIEFKATNKWFKLEGDFINTYSPLTIYNIVEKEEYPQFKASDDTEVSKLEKDKATIMISENPNRIGIDYKSDLIKYLKPIPYNEEKGLYHKQPIWCWDEEACSARIIRFYDVVNDCTFMYDGSSGGILFDNIEPITPEQLKTMPFLWEMYKQLKD
jgi:hypothetical protein